MEEPSLHSIIQNTIKNPHFHFPRQRRMNRNGEITEDPELPNEEKEKRLKELLKKDPALFLERYGQLLDSQILQLFEPLSDNYEVSWYLKEIKSKHVGDRKIVDKITIKNRRYKFLQQLEEKGEYFTKENMKLRNPALYYHYVGKYTKEEQAPYQDSDTLLERLLHDSDLCKAQAVMDEERAKEKIHIVNEDESENISEHESESEEEGLIAGVDDKKEKEIEDVEMEEEEGEIDEERKDEYYKEFEAIMKRRFLDGLDKDFDYKTVDYNQELDDFQQISRDAEEKYFDSD